MSLSQKQNDVARTLKDLATLQKHLADEKKKETTKLKEADTVQRSITKNTSPSMLRSKQQQLIRVSDDIAKIATKQADIQKKVADKNTMLGRQQESLRQEEAKERKKVQDADKRRESEQLRYQRELTNDLRTQSTLMASPTSISQPANQLESKRYDAFISHASEDKEDFVRPLAEALVAAGFAIWYDEMTLSVGDQLRRSIDKGLLESRYGIVVFSAAFFSKDWPQYELDGLVTREMAGGGKVILPIWHKVSKDEVTAYSPSLADKVAINSSFSSRDEIVKQLSEVLTQD